MVWGGLRLRSRSRRYLMAWTQHRGELQSLGYRLRCWQVRLRRGCTGPGARLYEAKADVSGPGLARWCERPSSRSRSFTMRQQDVSAVLEPACHS